MRRDRRAAWLLGLRDDPDATLEVWRDLGHRGVRLPTSPQSDTYCRATLPAVLFSSLSPQISAADAGTTSAPLSRVAPTAPALRPLIAHAPCPAMDAYKSGHALALHVRETLALGDEAVDVGATLGVPVVDVALDDPDTHGLSLVHGDAAVIAVNTRSIRSRTSIE